MKKIFIMNLGTTSFKFKLYSFSEAQQQVLASGEIESVGALESAYDLQWGDGKKCVGKTNISDHGAGFAFCISMLQESGILSNMDDLDAVGYKAVHGGSLSGTQTVTDSLLEEMERMAILKDVIIISPPWSYRPECGWSAPPASPRHCRG